MSLTLRRAAIATLLALTMLLSLIAVAPKAEAHTGYCVTHLNWIISGQYRHNTGYAHSNGYKLTIIQRLGAAGYWYNYTTIYKFCG